VTLKFVEKTHAYFLDGKRIPGVTTLLGKGLPKPALPYWSARCVAEYVIDQPQQVESLRTMGRNSAVAALKQVPWTQRDEAAIRGTDVHALAEKIVHGESVDVPEHLVGHVEGFANLIDEIGLVPVLTERPVINRKWWYAGTFDLVAEVAGEVLLLDTKTSKAIYGSVACQVAAYANAEKYIDADGAEQDMLPITGIGAIHVTEAGSRLHRFPDMPTAWKCFQHIAWVAKRIPEIDGWAENT
jgi:hypothetical protein